VPLWYPTISHKELFLVGNATRGRRGFATIFCVTWSICRVSFTDMYKHCSCLHCLTVLALYVHSLRSDYERYTLADGCGRAWVRILFTVVAATLTCLADETSGAHTHNMSTHSCESLSKHITSAPSPPLLMLRGEYTLCVDGFFTLTVPAQVFIFML